jgi:hypothetical protein
MPNHIYSVRRVLLLTHMCIEILYACREYASSLEAAEMTNEFAA